MGYIKDYDSNFISAVYDHDKEKDRRLQRRKNPIELQLNGLKIQMLLSIMYIEDFQLRAHIQELQQLLNLST